MRRPSELTHVRPATLSRRSVPSASMRSSRALASRSISRAWVARSSPHAATGSSRSRNSARSTSAPKSRRRHPRLLRAGRRRPQGPAPAALHRELADARPRARGARQPRRVDAGQLARVLRRLDRQQAVRALGVGELGGGEGVEMDVARRLPVALGLTGERRAQHRPRVAVEDLALQREQQRRGERRRAHQHLLAGLHVEAVARQQRREAARIRCRDQTRFTRVERLVDDRRGAAPARRRAGDLDRQAGDREARRRRQGAEVVELLDLAVLAVDARAVRLPQDRGVARLLELGAQRQQWAVQAPGVGPDHLHALLEQPGGRLAREAGAGVEVLGGVPGLLRAGPQQHDVVGRERVARRGERGLEGGRPRSARPAASRARRAARPGARTSRAAARRSCAPARRRRWGSSATGASTCVPAWVISVTVSDAQPRPSGRSAISQPKICASSGAEPAWSS